MGCRLGRSCLLGRGCGCRLGRSCRVGRGFRRDCGLRRGCRVGRGRGFRRGCWIGRSRRTSCGRRIRRGCRLWSARRNWGIGRLRCGRRLGSVSRLRRRIKGSLFGTVASTWTLVGRSRREDVGGDQLGRGVGLGSPPMMPQAMVASKTSAHTARRAELLAPMRQYLQYQS